MSSIQSLTNGSNHSENIPHFNSTLKKAITIMSLTHTTYLVISMHMNALRDGDTYTYIIGNTISITRHMSG